MSRERERASAVLVNWRRPGNIPRIVESLRAVEWVDDITIWNNGYKLAPMEGVRVVGVGRNVKLWGRFRAALTHADHDLIVTQDDDGVVNNWAQLYDTALHRRDRIVGNMHLNEKYGGVIPCCDEVDVVAYDIMLGWGSVFKRSWVGPAFQPYLDRYGVDDILMREADRVFAVMQGVRHIAVQAQVTDLDDVNTPGIALNQEEGRKDITKEARRRAVRLLKERVRGKCS